MQLVAVYEWPLCAFSPQQVAMSALTMALLVLGGAGGVLNAALSDNMRVLPARIRCNPDWTRRPTVCLGLLVNAGIGAAAAFALAWVFIDPAAHVGARSSTSVLRVFGAGFVVGFVAARCATNETDKWLLHAAVCAASAAPAAHPDVIRVIGKSRPFAILRIAQDLM
ncbi:MAG: hypothetical protein ACRD26_10710, partial [Vicinamibacterales bacterium]